MIDRLSLSADRREALDHLRASIRNLRGIVGFTLGGSTGTGLADDASDLDLHVYWRPPLADVAERRAALDQIADPGSTHLDVRSWGLEDHLQVGGHVIELVYVNLDDLAAQIDQAYGAGLRDESYATASLHNLANGHVLHDPTGELAAQQARLRTFPEPTRHHVLRYGPPLLRMYLKLLQRAQARNDHLFVQQQCVAIQAVFFNVLLTLNRVYHPGGKRLLLHLQRCPIQPPDCAARWIEIVDLATTDPALAPALHQLISDLIDLIERHGDVAIASYPF